LTNILLYDIYLHMKRILPLIIILSLITGCNNAHNPNLGLSTLRQGNNTQQGTNVDSGAVKESSMRTYVRYGIYTACALVVIAVAGYGAKKGYDHFKKKSPSSLSSNLPPKDPPKVEEKSQDKPKPNEYSYSSDDEKQRKDKPPVGPPAATENKVVPPANQEPSGVEQNQDDPVEMNDPLVPAQTEDHTILGLPVVGGGGGN
jgi:hypothetical protein